MKKFHGIILSLVLVLSLFVGCAKAPVDGANLQKDKSVELTISAAASLTDCLKEMKDIYKAENPNVDITYNFGASGALQQQIEQGAPTDVFLSAGQKQMIALEDKDIMINDSIKDILGNKVVLITPTNAKTTLTFDDLATDSVDKIAMGEPGSVPVGQYSEETLKNLNLLDKIENKLIFAKDVREVLSWVETENVDAGLVYQTDAEITEKVSISAIAPEDSHKAVIYPIGILKSTQNLEASEEFVEFLFTNKAKETFEKYGFSPLF